MTEEVIKTKNLDWVLLDRQHVRFWRKDNNEFFISLVRPREIFGDHVNLCEMGDSIDINQFRPVGIHNGSMLVGFALNFNPTNMQESYRSLPFQFTNTMDVTEASWYVATAFAMNNMESKLVDQIVHPVASLIISKLDEIGNITFLGRSFEKVNYSGECMVDGAPKTFSLIHMVTPGMLYIEGNIGDRKIMLRTQIDPVFGKLTMVVSMDLQFPVQVSFGDERSTWKRDIINFCENDI